MSRYARLNPDSLAVDAVIDLTDAQYHALDGNPKQAFVRPFVVDAKPEPSSTQTVQSAGYIVEPTQVRQAWSLVDKPAEQIAAEQADAAELAELQQIKLVMADLQAGTGTAAERIKRVERVALWFLRRVLRERGL